MKWFTLAMLAVAATLAGCASTTPNGEVVKSEEVYVPLGTLIAKKGPNRADGVNVLDKQDLENQRQMSNGTNNSFK